MNNRMKDRAKCALLWVFAACFAGCGSVTAIDSDENQEANTIAVPIPDAGTAAESDAENSAVSTIDAENRDSVQTETPDSLDTLNADSSGNPDSVDTPGDENPDEDADTTDSADAEGDGETNSDIEESPQPDVEIPEGDTSSGPVELPTARTCTLQFSVALPPETVSAAVPNELNNWSTTEWALTFDETDSRWKGEFDLNGIAVGAYGYKIILDDTNWILDPENPERIFVDGTENSRLRVPNCKLPLIEVTDLTFDPKAGSLDLTAVVRDGLNQSGILSEDTGILMGGEAIEGGFNPDNGTLKLAMEDMEAGKHSLTLFAQNEEGEAAPVYIPLWVEEEPFSWEDSILYFALVDRFADDLPGPDAPDCPDLNPNSNSSWLGGDWVGLKNKIEEGYFTDMGINTLWITSPMNNPEGCFNGTIENQLYTAYHGYFPDSYLEVEERHGTMEDLKAMVDAAHARGIRVIADLVLNHVYETHALVAEEPDWFFPLCQCGFECDWNAFAVECWFETYLPDLDYSYGQAVEQVVDVAAYWLREVDFDGFRVDAVKHMHDHLFFSLRHRLEKEVSLGNSPLYLVGETFTGDWGNGTGGEAQIAPYVNDQMLHGQFDFPLYWQIVRAFARGETGLNNLQDVLSQTTGYYNGVMSSFLGNHDVPRFMSHAAGQIGDVWGNGSKQQGFDNPPAQPETADAYAALRMAQSFLYAIPGVPLTYYGDEIGLAGAGDPDNRRMMSFENWSEEQEKTHQHLSELGQLRLKSRALRRGDLEIVYSTPDQLVLKRTEGEERVLIAWNRWGDSVEIPVGLSDWQGWNLIIGEGKLTESTINVPARSSVFWKR